MRLSTIVLSFIALGVAAVSASTEQDNAPAVRSFERKMEVRDPRKHSKRRSEQLFTDATLTWYGGGQLDAPACGGSTPSKWDHVVAVKQGGPFSCGDEVHIHWGGKMVKASVVDMCSGCAAHHLDLTQGLFQEFGSLDIGVMKNAHVRLIPKN